jgi:hypothetical protein
MPMPLKARRLLRTSIVLSGWNGDRSEPMPMPQ